MLHITNGDSAADSISQSGLGGLVLPWRDVLHEGPVPARLDLEALSEVRGRFISDAGWAPESAAPNLFEARDSVLRQAGAREDVVLWFEADLYDQLQLIQLLDWFHEHPPRSLSLICIAEHPAVARFVGLGQLSPGHMADLFPTRQLVTPAQLKLGRDAWAAFRAPTPSPLVDFLARDTAPLPFLASALHRMLEEYPSAEAGLGRSDEQVLNAVSQGSGNLSGRLPGHPGHGIAGIHGRPPAVDPNRGAGDRAGARRAVRDPGGSTEDHPSLEWHSASTDVVRPGISGENRGSGPR